MTVCIAALCRYEAQPRVVFASDRMVQWGGIVEFEHTQPKVTAESSHTVAMIAGDALVGTKLASDVAGALAGASQPVANIAAALVQGYDAMRRGEIEQQFLRPRGLDFQTFYDRHAQLNPNVVGVLDQAMAQYNPGVELLLAGIDAGGHLYSINQPFGMSRLHDVIGYAAVGSGMLHALQSMIGFRHSADAALPETVFRVYASKRRAEVAPGVGEDTDMGLIAPEGMRWLTEEEKRGLREIYDEHEAMTSSALITRLSSFTFGQASTTVPDEPGDLGGEDDAGDDDEHSAGTADSE